MSFLQLRSAYFDNSAVPLVTTQVATSITSAQATGNGTVVQSYGSTITERGFVWNTTGNPTTSDSKVTVAGTTGAFSGTISPLTASTTYYYRAYAINAFGTGYGDIWLIVTGVSGGISSRLMLGMGM